MDLASLAQSLIDKNTRQTEHLSHVLRGTARTNYVKGVNDCLRLMQQAALAEEQAVEGVRPNSLPPITGPLGVQAAHSATDTEGTNEISD